jgi:hypothetical protein
VTAYVLLGATLLAIAFVLLVVELTDRRQRRAERDWQQTEPLETALGPKGNVDVLPREHD